MIETDDAERLEGFVSPTPVGPLESVAVVEYQPQRVALRARLDRPGLVILADTDYPGWRLTIDGQPAPILRANRLMRGAAVPAGEHTLVYTYQPDSFRLGAFVSAAGLIALAALAWSFRREPPAAGDKRGRTGGNVGPGSVQPKGWLRSKTAPTNEPPDSGVTKDASTLSQLSK